MAAADEFLIEKTPMYGRADLTRVRQMHIMKPDVKLFYLIIDPVERIISHIEMKQRGAERSGDLVPPVKASDNLILIIISVFDLNRIVNPNR